MGQQTSALFPSLDKSNGERKTEKRKKQEKHKRIM